MDTEQIKALAIEALESMKAQDITTLDVKERTSVTDFMVIATGSSSRHLQAVANQVTEAGKNAGIISSGAKGRTTTDWVLIDLGDVVVHVMTEQARGLYDLEKLWGESFSKADV
jgi:ribosome-associated protein